jgi:fructokinase
MTRLIEQYRAGIDLGGTKTEIVVLDQQLQVKHRRRVPTRSQSYDAVLAGIADLVFEADRLFETRLPVGIGTPGALSPQTGLLRNSNTVCMNGRAFAQDIEQRLDRSVSIQNDANCFTLSESRNGAARNASVVFGVIVGTGTGGGLVVNGQLLDGRHRIAGEWGHNPLPWYRAEEGSLPCYCGLSDCIETFLSGPGLEKRYQRRFGQNLSSEQIVTAARAGDSGCAHALDRYYDEFTRALAHVINIIDPDMIVLGGGMSNIAEIYQQIPSRLPQYVFSDCVTTPIVAAEHGDSSGVFGAALL